MKPVPSEPIVLGPGDAKRLRDEALPDARFIEVLKRAIPSDPFIDGKCYACGNPLLSPPPKHPHEMMCAWQDAKACISIKEM